MTVARQESSRRARLKPEEKRAILASTIETGELAKLHQVTPETIRKYRPIAPTPVEVVARRSGYAEMAPAIKSLIDAYEDGRFARRKWGAAAVCIYKGEHAVAWRLGFESR